jgi:hypothetical protein
MLINGQPFSKEGPIYCIIMVQLMSQMVLFIVQNNHNLWLKQHQLLAKRALFIAIIIVKHSYIYSQNSALLR